MASPLNLNIRGLSLINQASTASRKDLDSVPNEILERILAYTFASEVPFHLQEFIELGERHPFLYELETEESRCWFMSGLPSSQKEHYLDWLVVNGTSRRFRHCGKLIFFSNKIIIIAPRLLKALQDGSCKNISAPDKAAIFSHAEHVIAPLPPRSIATQFMKLPIYNAFTRIHVLSIQPHVRDRIELPRVALATASTPMASQPVQMGDPKCTLLRGTPKRHSAPEGLPSLLEGIGLQVGRMKVDLIHRDTENSRRYFIDELANQVYPYLLFTGRQKAKKRVAEGWRSSTSG